MNLLFLLLFLQVPHAHKPHKPGAPVAAPAPTPAPDSIFGTWLARDKTMISIFPCGVTNGQPGDPKEACIRLLEPSSHIASETTDEENPNRTKRQRPVRALIVGTGFRVSDPEDALNGKLYDADNGRTYKTTIKLADNQLKVHSTRFLFFGHTLTCHRIELAKPSPYKR